MKGVLVILEEDKENKNIYILLTHTGTLFTRFIKVYTKAPYNHASLSLDNELNDLYSFGRRNVYNMFYAGFMCEDVYEGLFSYFPRTKCSIYKVEVDDQSYEKCRRLIRYFEKNKEKYVYNYLGIFGFLIDRPVGMRGTYFCSQFVAEIMNRVGFSITDKEPGLALPDDFRNSERLKLVYEGNLYEYEPISCNLEKVKKRKSVLNSTFRVLKKINKSFN